MKRDSVGAGRRGGALLVVCGAIGLASAVTLLLERAAMRRDPDYIPSCSISPIISCGSVMESDQASVFGFPNPYLGVVGFLVVIATGVALLARWPVPRGAWIAFTAGCLLGLAFVHYLIFQSLYRIGALCPYCMVVWVVMITIFCWTIGHVLRSGAMGSAAAGHRVVARLGEYWTLVVTVWLLLIAGLIARRFWDYWESVLS